MHLSILKLAFICAVLISSSRYGYAQFLGGESDGHANIRLSNITCSATNVNPFTGGAADGHANSRLTNTSCTVTNVNPFAGGVADGHSNQRLTNVTCAVINVNPFSGGQADGHSNTRLSNVTCAVINVNPFIGGEADGHSNVNLTNNPLCLPLPIELLNFQATMIDKVVEISWSTSMEIENDFFTVEKSKDGVTFEKIADVDAAGNSNVVLHYSLIDDSPYHGITYYRLRQTDFSKQVEYSPIVSVNRQVDVAGSVNVYPGPFADALTIEVIGGNPAYIELLNPLGVLVYSGLVTEKITLPTGMYSPGVYIIKFSDGVNLKTQKAIKQ